MNRFFPETILVLLSWTCAPNLWAESPDIEEARRHGAQGQMTLRVVDSTGKPVADAKLSLAYWDVDSSAGAVVSEGQTDTNGLCVTQGNTVGDMNFNVTKEGFYGTAGKYWFYRPSGLDSSKRSAISPTSGEYWLYNRSENGTKDGRWQPWNPTNTIVLKEYRNPIAMFAMNIDAPIPVWDAPIGFDLEVGDWLAPYGAGRQPDLYMTYKAKIQDYWNGSLEFGIACTNQGDGFVRLQKDMESDLRSAYEAPCSGYLPEIQFAFVTTTDKDILDNKLGDADYLAFRVRTRLDDKGDIVTARYGKIYGPIEFGVGKDHHIRFCYYLNPTDKDRNLEFDPSRNLLANSDRMRVNAP